MKRLSIILAAAALSASVNAQNIKDYVKSSPSSVLQCIDSLGRADMFDKTVTGVFGDSVIVHTATDDFTSFSVANLDVQIRLADDVIIVCSTYASENSEISFYDTEWKLKSSWIYDTMCCKKMPSDKKIFEALIVKPEDMSYERFEQLKLYFDPMLVRAELSDKDNSITLTPVAPMLSDEERKELNTVIKQKTFKWINGKFK